jgi:hypothetical protein
MHPATGRERRRKDNEPKGSEKGLGCLFGGVMGVGLPKTGQPLLTESGRLVELLSEEIYKPELVAMRLLIPQIGETGLGKGFRQRDAEVGDGFVVGAKEKPSVKSSVREL